MHRPRRTPHITSVSRAAVAATAVVASLGLGAGTAFAAGTGSSPSPSTTPHHHSKGSKVGANANVALPPNPTLQQVKAAAATDISNRVNDLNAHIARLQKDKTLGSDQADLISQAQAEVTGLQQLGQKIAGDNDLATAQGDYMNIFTQYRVYVFELPRDALVTADDRITNGTGPRLTKEAAAIQAKETPANQAQVQPLLADLATQVTNANNTLAGQSAALVKLRPSSWDANQDLLKPERTSTKSAAGDIKKAVSDAKQAAQDVGIQPHGRKHSKSKGGTPTSTPTSPSSTS